MRSSTNQLVHELPTVPCNLHPTNNLVKLLSHGTYSKAFNDCVSSLSRRGAKRCEASDSLACGIKVGSLLCKLRLLLILFTMTPRVVLRSLVALSPILLSLVNSQSAPAQTTVPETTAANAPLLDAERIELTDAVIERIANEQVTSSVAENLVFESDSTVSRNFSSCKTYPGDALWPSATFWDVLDTLLNNSLIPTVPISSPCYDSKWGSKDAAKCSTVINTFGQPLTQ